MHCTYCVWEIFCLVVRAGKARKLGSKNVHIISLPIQFVKYPRKQCSFPIKKEDTYHTTILQPNTTCDIQYWYWYQGLDNAWNINSEENKRGWKCIFQPDYKSSAIFILTKLVVMLWKASLCMFVTTHMSQIITRRYVLTFYRKIPIFVKLEHFNYTFDYPVFIISTVTYKFLLTSEFMFDSATSKHRVNFTGLQKKGWLYTMTFL